MVALLAEGVDRNYEVNGYGDPDKVALLAEGVDRNITQTSLTSTVLSRPPRGGRG